MSDWSHSKSEPWRGARATVSVRRQSVYQNQRRWLPAVTVVVLQQAVPVPVSASADVDADTDSL